MTANEVSIVFAELHDARLEYAGYEGFWNCSVSQVLVSQSGCLNASWEGGMDCKDY